jgi:hypothetical protein
MTHANTMLRSLLIFLLLFGPGRPGLRAGEPVDMSEFLRRAESIGLSTFFLRRLLKKIDVHAGNPGGGAEASWSYLRGRVIIQEELLEEGRHRLPFDLRVSALGTVFHELTHAANSVMADPKQPRVSPAGAHHEVVEAIRGDLFIEEEESAFLGLPRYPRVKADEVTGYFMGLALNELFMDVATLLSTNRLAPGLVIRAPGDAAALGGRIVAPDDSEMAQTILRRRYGEVSLSDQTYFQGKAFTWRPERVFLKHEMWDKFLALHPPRTGAELIERLNTIDNAWIRGVRAEIAAARKAHEAKLQEVPSAADLPIYGVE